MYVQFKVEDNKKSRLFNSGCIAAFGSREESKAKIPSAPAEG
jgi:hypothetical protein